MKHNYTQGTKHLIQCKLTVGLFAKLPLQLFNQVRKLIQRINRILVDQNRANTGFAQRFCNRFVQELGWGNAPAFTMLNNNSPIFVRYAERPSSGLFSHTQAGHLQCAAMKATTKIGKHICSPKKRVVRNASAMHNAGVPVDASSAFIFWAYAVFAGGLIGWLLLSTAGWASFLGIIAMHLIILTLCLMAPPPRLSFKGNPFRGNLLKPSSDGGGMVKGVAAPSTDAERNTYCGIAN